MLVVTFSSIRIKSEKHLEYVLRLFEEEKKSIAMSVREELQSSIDKACADRDVYFHLYSIETKQRREIHDKLMEVQGNIRVICRVRPVLELELEVGSAQLRAGQDQVIAEFPTEEDIVVRRDASCKVKFEFDKVFPPSSTQDEVFGSVQPLCISVLDGYNVCIFACKLHSV